MGLGKLLLVLIVCAIFLTLGFAIYPTFHTLYDSTNTTGFLPLTAAGVKAMPYVLLGVIAYGAILIFRQRGR